MPELPEVENYRKYLEGTSLHRPIAKVWIDDPKLIKPNKKKFTELVKNTSMVSTDRVGKYLFVNLDNGGCIVMHFGLTGNLSFFHDKVDMPKYTRVLFEFAGGSYLSYICKRKFGWVAFEDNMKAFLDNNRLGVDATKLRFDQFYNSIVERKAPVKTLLLDQSIAAGVGNWIADEILYQSKIHPETKTIFLNKKEIRVIYDKLKKILKVALKAEANFDKFPKYFLIHNRHKKGKCYHTGKSIERIVVGGRGTFISPALQKLKKK